MDAGRVILHADLDAFFAAVEQLDNPSLCGKPVLVGGAGPRGVVCAASYEARPFGCRSAMPMARARTLCPHAIILPPRFKRYCELSDRFMALLNRFSPIVEAMSLDEAFVDVSGSQPLFGSGAEIARQIRHGARTELGLAVSVGVAPNKFTAKLASDLAKPDGLLEVPATKLTAWLAPMDISRMWGVGPRTLPRYHAAGIRTLGDLQRMTPEEAHRALGDHGLVTRRLALGIDERPVEAEHEVKGVGKERTFPEDLTDPACVLNELHALTQAACSRLRAKGSSGGTGGGSAATGGPTGSTPGGLTRRLTLKIRFGNFETITRSATLPTETDSTLTIWKATRATFMAWAAREFQPVRLIGIRLECLASGAYVPDLFTDPRTERERALDRVADAIEARFGPGSARRGGQQRSPHSSV